MGVDGGAGNAISFSELQTFYGGSDPISLSEYYRNGSLVPGDQVTAQSNTSGTADQTVGQFSVDVTTTSTFSGSISVANVLSVTVTAATAYISFANRHRDADGGSSTVVNDLYINGSFNRSFTTEDSTGNGAVIIAGYLRGPANNGAVDGSNTLVSAGDVVTTVQAGFQDSESRLGHATRAQVTTHDVDFTNNNAVTITTTSGSTGGAQTYTQNQTRKVKNDQSTPNWTLGYDAVLGNTNVPASGTINMDVFNAPGTPTP